MHYSTDITDLKNAVEYEELSVRKIANAWNFKTKMPMSMFFCELEIQISIIKTFIKTSTCSMRKKQLNPQLRKRK